MDARSHQASSRPVAPDSIRFLCRAGVFRFSPIVVLVIGFAIFVEPAWGQRLYRTETRNFIVNAPDAAMGRRAAELAEQYRKQLSLDWLGYEIKPWREKCPIQIEIGPHAGGETSFAFVEGMQSEPIGWQMKIFGPPNRILDSVLPHEITHTIFATHFGQPLPRWADEGACTTVEHESERSKNHQMLMEFLTSHPSRGIPFNRMFTMKRYPNDILPLYAQGYSVAKFLIAQKGRQAFIKYLEDGLAAESQVSANPQIWDEVTRRHYGFDNLSDLQVRWLSWVREGSSIAAAKQLGSRPDLAHVSAPSTTPTVASSVAAPMNDSDSSPEKPLFMMQPPLPPAGDHVAVPNHVLEHSGSWYLRQSKVGQSHAGQMADASTETRSVQRR